MKASLFLYPSHALQPWAERVFGETNKNDLQRKYGVKELLLTFPFAYEVWRHHEYVSAALLNSGIEVHSLPWRLHFLFSLVGVHFAALC